MAEEKEVKKVEKSDKTKEDKKKQFEDFLAFQEEKKNKNYYDNLLLSLGGKSWLNLAEFFRKMIKQGKVLKWIFILAIIMQGIALRLNGSLKKERKGKLKKEKVEKLRSAGSLLENLNKGEKMDYAQEGLDAFIKSYDRIYVDQVQDLDENDLLVKQSFDDYIANKEKEAGRDLTPQEISDILKEKYDNAKFAYSSMTILNDWRKEADNLKNKVAGVNKTPKETIVSEPSVNNTDIPVVNIPENKADQPKEEEVVEDVLVRVQSKLDALKMEKENTIKEIERTSKEIEQVQKDIINLKETLEKATEALRKSEETLALALDNQRVMNEKITSLDSFAENIDRMPVPVAMTPVKNDVIAEEPVVAKQEEPVNVDFKQSQNDVNPPVVKNKMIKNPRPMDRNKF